MTYPQAREAFEQVARTDPECAMARTLRDTPSATRIGIHPGPAQSAGLELVHFKIISVTPGKRCSPLSDLRRAGSKQVYFGGEPASLDGLLLMVGYTMPS